MIRLSDIFDLQMGKTPARANSEYWTGNGNKWISITDLSGYDKYVTQTKELISDLAVKESGIKPIPSNTVIMSFKLSLGKTAITTELVYSNEAIMAFIPTGKYQVLPDYYYYLLSSIDWNKGTNRAVMGATLNKATLSEFCVDVPPIETQKQIAANLDKATQTIDLCNSILEKLDLLVKARFVEMTQSDRSVIPTRMGDIASYINGYAFKPTDWTETGKPIIRIQNLNDLAAKFNFYSGELDEKYAVSDGDILVSWATHLEAYIWNRGDAWLNQHIFKAVFDKMTVNKIYFVYATEEALRQAFKNAHGFKPTMEHIKRSDFENAIVQLPSLETQNQFAAFVEKTDRTKAAVKQVLAKAETLKKALMQEYFG